MHAVLKNKQTKKQELKKLNTGYDHQPVPLHQASSHRVQLYDWMMAVSCLGSLILLLQLNWCQPDGKTKWQDVGRQVSQTFNASTGQTVWRSTRGWCRVQDHLKATQIRHIWHSFVDHKLPGWKCLYQREEWVEMDGWTCGRVASQATLTSMTSWHLELRKT